LGDEFPKAIEWLLTQRQLNEKERNKLEKFFSGYLFF
jgi:hypothetical protein